MSFSNLISKTKNKTKTTGVSDFMELELTLIYPNPTQPRKSFKNIDELAQSITVNGLIQPIAVVKDGMGKYMIVSGERRYKASLLANKKTIKAHIIKANSEKIKELSLIENIQRDDLTDFEIANFITALWNSGQYQKKKDLAKALSKSDSYISKSLSLVSKLNEDIKKDLDTSKSTIGLSVLDTVARVPAEQQKEIYTKIKKGEIKRADIKDIIKKDKIQEKLSPVKVLKSGSGFSTINEFGQFITIVNGDFEATLKFNKNVDFIENKRYKVTIEEL